MKEFILTKQESERTVLVGIITQTQNETKANEYLDELAFLAETAGAEPVKKFLQRLEYPNPVTFVGAGKLQEIKDYVEENEIGLVIFDDDLSPKQLKNIEKELQVKGEVSTEFGETLSWKYLCFVRENPIEWNIFTEILYAGTDNLTSRETVENFFETHNAALTVMEDGDHWFHTEEQIAFLDEWMKKRFE